MVFSRYLRLVNFVTISISFNSNGATMLIRCMTYLMNISSCISCSHIPFLHVKTHVIKALNEKMKKCTIFNNLSTSVPCNIFLFCLFTNKYKKQICILVTQLIFLFYFCSAFFIQIGPSTIHLCVVI